MNAVRIEGGEISAEVSRGLADLMHGCSFFARMEVDGWLELVKSEGHVVRTMNDVPANLRRLLSTGTYGPASESDGETNLEPVNSDVEDGITTDEQ